MLLRWLLQVGHFLTLVVGLGECHEAACPVAMLATHAVLACRPERLRLAC